jgi:hypothetical protein
MASGFGHLKVEKVAVGKGEESAFIADITPFVRQVRAGDASHTTRILPAQADVSVSVQLVRGT